VLFVTAATVKQIAGERRQQRCPLALRALQYRLDSLEEAVLGQLGPHHQVPMHVEGAVYTSARRQHLAVLRQGMVNAII
jgi:hypothetical protein